MICYKQNEIKIIASVKVDEGLKNIGKEPGQFSLGVKMLWWEN